MESLVVEVYSESGYQLILWFSCNDIDMDVAKAYMELKMTPTCAAAKRRSREAVGKAGRSTKRE